jgi:hypothetical protein
MLILYRLACTWLMLTVAVACVVSPKFALMLLCSLLALGCYTLLVISVPRLRRPTALLLAALARPHGKV